MYFKTHLSWYRFFIDFGTVLGGPGRCNKWFSLRRGSNFEVFVSSNISYLLESQKHRFWEAFGGQVGYRKYVRWLQEASWAEVTKFVGVPKRCRKMSVTKSPIRGTQEFSGDATGTGGGPLNQFNPGDQLHPRTSQKH